ncbi:MAG: hypothetical protein C4527_06755, partial [Candidatus Omnitrophota bacterium]
MNRFFWRLYATFVLCLLSTTSFGLHEVLLELNHAQDWHPLHDIDGFSQMENGITFDCNGSDPYIISKILNFPAAEFTAIEIEMKVTKGSQAQIFWTTDGQPNTDEPKSQRFRISADDQFHRYTVSLANHPKWTGEIRQIRLDPSDTKATVILRSFKIIDFLGADVKVNHFSPNHPFVQPDEEVILTASLRNEGDQAGVLRLQTNLPSSVLKSLDELPEKIVTLQPGEEKTVEWRYLALQEGVIAAVCSWREGETHSDEEKEGTISTIVQVIDIEKPAETISLQDESSRIDFLRGGMGFGPTCFSLKKNNEWKQVAWMARIGTVRIQLEDGSAQNQPILANQFKSENEDHYTFSNSWTDQDNREWNFELRVRKSHVIPNAFHFSYRLSGEGQLLHFSGPELYIGERTFGRKKDMAVLPGVEYLDREAVSSSDAVARPPVRDHFMPHPYKVAIPMMSLTYDNMLISLLWSAADAGAKEGRELSPIFGAPNRLDGQNNHLFGLFLPPVPTFTRENEDTAFKPYGMKRDEPLEIDCIVYLTESSDPMDALDAWLAMDQRENNDEPSFPQPIPAPRGYEEEIVLSRQAYLTTCWDDNAKGWGHCAGWKAYPSGGMLALLSLDEFLSQNENDKNVLRERIELVKKTILEQRGPAGLGEAAGCHVMNFEPAFYWGVTENKLPQWKQMAIGLERSQNHDGSWGFHPGNEQQKN